jgi:hypothetical protein
MAKYGNILMIFNPQGTQLADVENILTTNKADFELCGSTFFVETNSLEHTRKVEAKLAATAIFYTFFHNRISDGSFLKSSINNPDVLAHIQEILFE